MELEQEGYTIKLVDLPLMPLPPLMGKLSQLVAGYGSMTGTGRYARRRGADCNTARALVKLLDKLKLRLGKLGK